MKKPVSGRKERALNLAAIAAFAAPSADALPRNSVNTVLIAGEPLTLAVDRYAPRGASACRLTFGGALLVSSRARLIAARTRIANRTRLNGGSSR